MDKYCNKKFSHNYIISVEAKLTFQDLFKVLQLFEEIQKRHRRGYMNDGFETDITNPQRDSTYSQTGSETDSGLYQPTPADSLSSLHLSQHGNMEDEDES